MSTLLPTFLALAEEIHAELGDGGSVSGEQGARGAETSAKLKRLLETDAQLQEVAASLLQERDKQAKTRKLLDKADTCRGSLLQLAGRMRSAEARLSEAIDRARDALSAADATGSSSDRSQATPDVIIELAERVSYSNAAPCSQVAFMAGGGGPGAQEFFEGWGMPAPQPHMLKKSRFAAGQPAAAEKAGTALDLPDSAAVSASGTAASAGDPAEAASLVARAPSFVASAQPVGTAAAASAGRKHVSLDLGSDDDDDDDDDA